MRRKLKSLKGTGNKISNFIYRTPVKIQVALVVAIIYLLLSCLIPVPEGQKSTLPLSFLVTIQRAGHWLDSMEMLWYTVYKYMLFL